MSATMTLIDETLRVERPFGVDATYVWRLQSWREAYTHRIEQRCGGFPNWTVYEGYQQLPVEGFALKIDGRTEHALRSEWFAIDQEQADRLQQLWSLLKDQFGK